MPNRHTCRESTIMTGRTVISDTLMAKGGRPETTSGNMTNVTIIGRRYVIRLVYLAGRIGPIVAGITTCILHLRAVMVDESAHECCGVMTHGTITGSSNVTRIFTCNRVAVMAGITANTQDIRAGMVNHLRFECDGVVADRAITVQSIMQGIIRFTQGVYGNMVRTAIVAGCAVTGNAGMIKIGCRFKGTDRMAITTIL